MQDKSNEGLLNDYLESIRKDVEWFFGTLKKRFLILKNPIQLHSTSKQIRNFETS